MGEECFSTNLEITIIVQQRWGETDDQNLVARWAPPSLILISDPSFERRSRFLEV